MPMGAIISVNAVIIIISNVLRAFDHDRTINKLQPYPFIILRDYP